MNSLDVASQFIMQIYYLELIICSELCGCILVYFYSLG